MQIVRPQLGTSAKQGDAIQSGTIIRLQHMRTRKWLHSHLHASPISGNLEVSFVPDPPFHLFFNKCNPSFPISYHTQCLSDNTWVEVANWDVYNLFIWTYRRLDHHLVSFTIFVGSDEMKLGFQNDKNIYSKKFMQVNFVMKLYIKPIFC